MPTSAGQIQTILATAGLDAATRAAEIARDSLASGALPDDARVGVFVQWSKTSAHTFICEKVNGSLRFVDPQTGKACPEYLTRGKKFGYYRMDTLTLQEHADWKTTIKAVPK
ncbi:MAG: hypothetical protein LBR94_02095 [Desulfovibrio sp.]|jgi:hypothetical protein|nr:hypothetical protein [Desulfovibrio sp.]